MNSSSSQGIVHLVRRCRDTLICFGAHDDSVVLVREDLAIPSVPLLSRVARTWSGRSRGQCHCSSPQIVRFILVSIDQEVISIRDEAHPRPLSIHPVEQVSHLAPENQADCCAAQRASLPDPHRNTVMKFAHSACVAPLLHHGNSPIFHNTTDRDQGRVCARPQVQTACWPNHTHSKCLPASESCSCHFSGTSSLPRSSLALRP